MGKKTIIAGSRGITDYDLLLDQIEACPWEISEVVSGTAEGVDLLGEQYADEHDLPVERHEPDWDTYGRAAGPIRNREMAESAEALLAVWDGQSPGTKNMIEEAEKAGIEVHVYTLEE